MLVKSIKLVYTWIIKKKYNCVYIFPMLIMIILIEY